MVRKSTLFWHARTTSLGKCCIYQKCLFTAVSNVHPKVKACTHARTHTHTHTSPHMPPQPTPGKALIQTKRLLLAKAKAMLQRPQQSLFFAEAFNTTTIQKRNTTWHTEELQQLNEPDCTERFRAFPSTAALDLLPCQKPAQTPIAGKPASGNTCTSEESQSL